MTQLFLFCMAVAAKVSPVPKELNVEVEWVDYMGCAACNAFAEELYIQRELSRKEENQAAKFKLEIEREEWVVERAIEGAAVDYAFLVTNPKAQDETRGKFFNIPELLKQVKHEGQQQALKDLQADPIYSLRTFITEVLEVSDTPIVRFVHNNASAESLQKQMCMTGKTPFCKRPHAKDTIVAQKKDIEDKRKKVRNGKKGKKRSVEL